MSFDIDNHQEERKDKRPEYELVIPPKDYTAPKSIYELNGLTGAEDAVFEYKNYHNGLDVMNQMKQKTVRNL